MIYSVFILFISLISQSGLSSVDQAIELYLMGDMNGSISALEILLDEGYLSLDEKIRSYHRLGAAYYGIGELGRAESAFHNVLLLDPYYDLGPWENPDLRMLLNRVRQESMSTIIVQGEPEGALVFMNGEYVGTAPFIQDNLIGGQTYVFTVLAEGFESDAQSFTTLPGQLHTLTYQMSPISYETEMAFIDTASTESQAGSTEADEVLLATSTTDIEQSVQNPPPYDTFASQGSGTVSMTAEQLTELLHGGIQMTSLGNIGPLTSGTDIQAESGGSQPQERNPTLFENTSRTIEIASESQARMVFSEVSINNDDILQTAPGASYNSRTSGEVWEVLSSKTSTVTSIYNKHLRSDPLLMGTVLVEMIIEPSGRVSDVSILESTTFNPAFDLELAAAVETWRFGTVDADEGPLPVVYPFIFSR